MNSPDLSGRLAGLLPDDLKADNTPVFEEPWQAQAFAMAVQLIETGVLRWSEWAAALGEEIARARDHGFAEDGSDYYQLWLRALEGLVTSRQLADGEELDQVKDAWQRAYATTPHGEPVTL